MLLLFPLKVSVVKKCFFCYLRATFITTLCNLFIVTWKFKIFLKNETLKIKILRKTPKYQKVPHLVKIGEVKFRQRAVYYSLILLKSLEIF